MTPQAVGIDLGTTYSLAAYVRDGKPQVVRDAAGQALVPSCICFHPDGRVLVGRAAQAEALNHPERTLFSIKRLMGKSLAEVQASLGRMPQKLVEKDVGDGRRVLQVIIGDRAFTPEELSAMILKEIRALAGHPTKAVITVPAYFNDSQRQATRDAGRIAGLEVLRIVNEPTAAALAYGLDKKASGTVVIYDLGGGTFDCSVLAITDGTFRVLSTNGNTALGGDDFDHELVQHFARHHQLDLAQQSPLNLQALRQAAQAAKLELTACEQTVMACTVDEQTYTLTIKRSDFEQLIEPHITRTLRCCQQALRDAGRSVNAIDAVVLVGGSTRVPLVKRRVAEFFQTDPLCDLNPDEVVALGAAIQADILAGSNRSLLLLDVVPLSLGIETLGGAMDKIIHRNSTIPCRETVRYTTHADHQTAIILKVYQGERELARDCRLLGEFRLSGIPPMPAQMAQVDVTFFVDANGMLSVTAREQRSGKEAAVNIQAAHGLDPHEVEQLVLESVAHAEDDFSQRQWIELRVKAEADLHHGTKVLAELHDELTEVQRQEAHEAAEELKAAAAGSSMERLKDAMQRFTTLMAPLAERLMNRTVTELLQGRRQEDIPNVLE